MSRTPHSSSRRHWRLTTGVVSVALVVALLPGAAAAQDAIPSPDPGVVQVVPVGPDGMQGGTIVVGEGTFDVGPDVVPPWSGGCATWGAVTVGPDGQTSVQSGPTVTCDEAGLTLGLPEPGAIGIVGSGEVSPSGGPIMLGSSGFGSSGTVTITAEPAHLVTVTEVNGSTVSLQTDDGWTRDLDTTNVAITLDSDTLTAADLAVGDRVLVVQVRNANDTYTVTGIQLILPEVMGVVSDITADGFTVTAMDGTTTTVHVSDATTWPVALPGGPAAGLSALKAGDVVVARGKLATDGSMDASSVLVQATITVSTGEPDVVPPTAGPAPTPGASPQG